MELMDKLYEDDKIKEEYLSVKEFMESHSETN